MEFSHLLGCRIWIASKKTSMKLAGLASDSVTGKLSPVTEPFVGHGSKRILLNVSPVSQQRELKICTGDSAATI